jgi:hypothetical protein
VRFRARCNFKKGGGRVFLGNHHTPEGAAAAYDVAMLAVCGRRAITNFPAEQYGLEALQAAAEKVNQPLHPDWWGGGAGVAPALAPPPQHPCQLAPGGLPRVAPSRGLGRQPGQQPAVPSEVKLSPPPQQQLQQAASPPPPQQQAASALPLPQQEQAPPPAAADEQPPQAAASWHEVQLPEVVDSEQAVMVLAALAVAMQRDGALEAGLHQRVLAGLFASAGQSQGLLTRYALVRLMHTRREWPLVQQCMAMLAG